MDIGSSHRGKKAADRPTWVNPGGVHRGVHKHRIRERRGQVRCIARRSIARVLDVLG
ncbi:hypothetical protein [Streptomyces sp. NPDC088254]|uniref:hypothetical protein n=1 Tax=Streptomyces sp. NPDC088254 TaxID=3365847 RepID=UPI0038131119